MAELRFGIAFQSDKTPARYAALAQVVDRYPFHVLSVYNDLFYQPAIGPLLVMAPHLRRAEWIGPAVLNPYTVHPVEIAGQIAVLDQLTDGRAYLGIGRGAWLDRVGVTSPQPVAAVKEAILVVKQLLAGDTGDFEGTVFRLAAGARFAFQPRRSAVPVVVGTWGQRMARLAGELADEVKIGASSNPAVAMNLRRPIDVGSARVGREPGSVGICVGTPTVVDQDRAAARDLARRIVAPYLSVVARLDPTIDDSEWINRIAAFSLRHDYASIAANTPDHLLERFVIAGNPDDVVDQVGALASAGVTRVEFGNPHGLDEAEGIRLLGERVLPMLAG